MIESDARLVGVLRKLSERPRMDSSLVVESAKRLLAQMPSVRLGTRVQDQRLHLSANRSRLVALKLQVLLEHSYLSRVKSDLEDYLHSKYANFLRGVNNERTRRAVIARALSPIEKRIAPLKTTLDVLELVLQDYDSRAYAFRDLVAAMRLGDRE